MERCRQERRGIEGKGYGGAEGAGIAENLPMGHSCRGPQGPSKPGKNARSTEDNRVRSRQVTPSRKTAVYRQRGGGERVQDRGGPAAEVGRNALGRGRSPRRLPPPRPLPKRERPVGRLLETRFLLQLIACITN